MGLPCCLSASVWSLSKGTTAGCGLSKYKKKIKLANRVICEYQEDKRAEVLVIRQYTTRKSGYHTKERQCLGILTNALEGAHHICQK